MLWHALGCDGYIKQRPRELPLSTQSFRILSSTSSLSFLINSYVCFVDSYGFMLTHFHQGPVLQAAISTR